VAQKAEGVAKVATIDCGSTPCYNVKYFPYIEVWVTREGQRGIEKMELDYNEDHAHPAITAMDMLGKIMRYIVGIEWEEKDQPVREEL